MARFAERRAALSDGRSCTLRSARLEDAGVLIEHVRALLEDGAGQVGLPEELALTVEQERDWIQAHLDRPAWIALVAEVDSELAGLVNFENGPRRRIAHRGMLGIGVQRAFRGLGVGCALMEGLVGWAEGVPELEKLCLAVRADNAPAIALYRAFGFVEEGRRVREIRLAAGEYVDDLLMARFLEV
jgi:RimJ/RimL family protein N-acetyltransferase